MTNQRADTGASAPDADTPKTDEAPAPAAGWAAPFDPTFFRTVLVDHASTYCPGTPNDVSVVLLHLADGTVLDLCHVAVMTPRWIGLVVFRDEETCEEMDLACVPYETILRVTVSRRPAEERRIGFQAERSAVTMSWPVEEG